MYSAFKTGDCILRATFVFWMGFATALSFASAQTSKIDVDLKKSIKVQFNHPEWNKSPTQVDSAPIVIRDAKTKKMVRVHMNETGENTGSFSGIYQITWKDSATTSPEIYLVPPENINKRVLPSQLKSLTRLPYLFRKDEKDQRIEVYASREEASKALEKIRSSKKGVTAESKKREEQWNQALSETAKEIEKMKADFKKLSKSEQEKRKKDSLAFVEAAMDFFRANQFEQAEEQFKKAFELDPNQDDIYFYYGVTLYKRDKFNQSLVFLEFAREGKFNPLERDFFKGMNLFRLNENQKALASFGELKKSKDPTFGPSAAFYEGLVNMKMEKYDEAKTHFQEVLDTSNDPALDQSAEDYIEKIERLKTFLKLKAKKFFFTASGGLQYDSNVLLVNSSSSSAGDPSRIADTRYLTGLSVEYRPVFEEKMEFSLKTKTDLIYSSKGDNAGADPLLTSLKAPFKYKGNLLGKGYKLEVIPGYENLQLDEDKSGATGDFFKALNEKELYLHSYTLDVMNSFVMKDSHILGINIKYREDYSESHISVGDNNPTATKFNLGIQNMFFFNDKKNLAFIGDLGYTINQAKGKSLTYNRYDVSAMMLFPVPWNFQGVGGIAYYTANYPDKSSEKRTDNDIAVSLNLIRPLKDWLNLTVGGTYTDNQSNLSANTYNKYVFMAVLTANWSL